MSKSGARPADQSPHGDNGCPCRWCVYDRMFAAEIVKVPEDARPFFEQLKEDWEAEANDASYWRNYWADEVAADAQQVKPQ